MGKSYLTLLDNGNVLIRDRAEGTDGVADEGLVGDFMHEVAEGEVFDNLTYRDLLRIIDEGDAVIEWEEE